MISYYPSVEIGLEQYELELRSALALSGDVFAELGYEREHPIYVDFFADDGDMHSGGACYNGGAFELVMSRGMVESTASDRFMALFVVGAHETGHCLRFTGQKMAYTDKGMTSQEHEAHELFATAVEYVATEMVAPGSGLINYKNPPEGYRGLANLLMNGFGIHTMMNMEPNELIGLSK